MPPPKPLSRHCLDGTFRARRHAHLLDGPLVPWPELASIQAEYQGTGHELERRALAVRFEQAVRAFSEEAPIGIGRYGGTTPTQPAHRRLTVAERWYASMGPGFGDWSGPEQLGLRDRDGSIDWDGFQRLRRRWDWWDARHGRFYRAARGIDHHIDRRKLVTAITGKAPVDVETVNALYLEHMASVTEIVADRQPIPDPPGMDLVGVAPRGARGGHLRHLRHA